MRVAHDVAHEHMSTRVAHDVAHEHGPFTVLKRF